MLKLNDLDYKILFELMKNSKISDRKLAKEIGVSQPTVTRRRARLEREGVLEYTAIPNFEKLGLGIIAFLFTKWNPEIYQVSKEEFVKKTDNFVKKRPNLILVSSGQGLGMTRMGMSIHKDYADFVKFATDLKTEWGPYVEEIKFFIISVGADRFLRKLTFKHLPEYLKNMAKLSEEKRA